MSGPNDVKAEGYTSDPSAKMEASQINLPNPQLARFKESSILDFPDIRPCRNSGISLFDLATETRCQIFSYLLRDDLVPHRWIDFENSSDRGRIPQATTALFTVNKQISAEALQTFYQENAFIVLETPKGALRDLSASIVFRSTQNSFDDYVLQHPGLTLTMRFLPEEHLDIFRSQKKELIVFSAIYLHTLVEAVNAMYWSMDLRLDLITHLHFNPEGKYHVVNVDPIIRTLLQLRKPTAAAGPLPSSIRDSEADIICHTGHPIRISLTGNLLQSQKHQILNHTFKLPLGDKDLQQMVWDWVKLGDRATDEHDTDPRPELLNEATCFYQLACEATVRRVDRMKPKREEDMKWGICSQIACDKMQRVLRKMGREDEADIAAKRGMYHGMQWQFSRFH